MKRMFDTVKLTSIWAQAASIFALCALVYCSFAGARLSHPTANNHYVHLAHGFLNGRLDVIDYDPKVHGQNDWACFDVARQEGCGLGEKMNERWYVSFPPFPAMVIMPAVAVFGLETKDALFWALLAALSPALLFVLLERIKEKTTRSTKENIAMTLLYAFGTVFFFVAVQGEVWFAAHVVASVLAPLYFYFAIGLQRPMWAGLVLGAMYLTRPTTLYLSFFVAAQVCLTQEGFNIKHLWTERKKLAIFAGALGLMMVVSFVFNWARFGHPMRFGHEYLTVVWQGRIEKWGLFSFHYLSKNLAIFTSMLPWFQRDAPHVVISAHGLAFWVTTPWLLVSFWPKWAETNRRMIHALWVGMVLVCLMNLMYQNSGWIQFGYRFSLDYMVPWILLLAYGGRRLSVMFWVCLVYAVGVNAFGAYTFNRKMEHYDIEGSQTRMFQPD